MKLKKEEVAFLINKEKRLTLEEVMMAFYEVSCRRVPSGFTDKSLEVKNLGRGSVIVTADEVIVVCNPLDFHLFPPPTAPVFRVEKSHSVFRAGTTLVQESGITFFDNKGDEKHLGAQSVVMSRFGGIMLDDRIPYDQMEDFTKSSYNLPGGHCRVTTCIEEVGLAGNKAAMRYF